jgi:hypothetical protein
MQVISEFVVQTNDTCTSLSSEQIQRIPNGLCDTQVEYVVSQGWPSSKLQSSLIHDILFSDTSSFVLQIRFNVTDLQVAIL